MRYCTCAVIRDREGIVRTVTRETLERDHPRLYEQWLRGQRNIAQMSHPSFDPDNIVGGSYQHFMEQYLERQTANLDAELRGLLEG